MQLERSSRLQDKQDGEGGAATRPLVPEMRRSFGDDSIEYGRVHSWNSVQARFLLK